MGKKKKKFRKPVNPQTVSLPQPSVEPEEGDRAFKVVRDPFRWISIAVIFVIGIAGYFTSFKNGFIWDDTMVITPNEYIRDWSHLKGIFVTDIHHFGLDKSNFYRPLQALSYMIDHTFWQLNPMGYHISSALIHILNAIIIYLIIFNIASHLDPRIKTRSRDLALASSCIWLVHPIHTQVVTYAAGRADQLVALFLFLTIYTFMVTRRKWVAPIFFVLALLSKEVAVITPLFILLLDCFGLTVRNDTRIRKLVPFIFILAVYIILRLTVLSFPTDFSTQSIPGLFQRQLTSARAVMILSGLLAFPFDLSMDRNIAWETSIANVKVIFSVLGIVAMAVVGFVSRKKVPVISFGLFWFFTGYLLVANIIPMNANVSEHWMYVPSIGLWIAILYLIIRFMPMVKRPVFTLFISLLVIYFGFFLVRRNADFKDEITFYNQILTRNYQNARVHYNLGCAYFFEGDEDKSYKHLMEAVRIKPDYAAAYGNLGQLEYRRGNVDKAIALYEKANELRGDLVENRANLGVAYVNKKRIQEGIDQLNVALQLNPKHVAALNNMGIAYGTRGEFSKAERYFNLAISINPDDESAKNNLNHLHALIQEHSK